MNKQYYITDDENGYWNGWGMAFDFGEAYLFETRKEAKKMLKHLQRSVGWECLKISQFPKKGVEIICV